MSTRKGPVIIEMDEGGPGPTTAPPVPDIEMPRGQAMTTLAKVGARPASRLGKWFWRLLLALLAFGLSVWTWDFVSGLIARNIWLGYAALGLVGLLLVVVFGIVIREWAAFGRLRRLDHLQQQALGVVASEDLSAARSLSRDVAALYANRPEMDWPLARLRERQAEVLDATSLLDLTETELLTPLDNAARAEVELAARQVATVTAVVPLALADVATAAVSNIRMIRRIAEIYGGRSGALGSWRLVKSVLSHLVATGAVAVGDDLIGTVAGGGVLSKVSRRFGEGVVNGALTARVGVAAIEVCRPMPFRARRRPRVTSLVQRALTGLFSRGDATD